jgi:Mg/Co/Ni transporter MgtE
MFPVASHLYKSQQPVAAAAGAVYAADLVGSAGAAVFAGAIAVPVLGVAGAAQLTALVAASALVLCLPLLRGERGS